MAGEELNLFASAAAGCEAMLAEELQELGASSVHPGPRGVAFRGDLCLAYRTVLWSRIASRVLLQLRRAPVRELEALDEMLRGIDWSQHLRPDDAFAIQARVSEGAFLRDQRYAVLRAKDVIVDQFRERFGRRPDVDREDPNLQLHLHVGKRWSEISIDLCGAPLHRRGYRGAGGPAPLKENVAAAILKKTGWQRESSGLLLDPFCGSGTLLCEAYALWADIAPGLFRAAPALLRWAGHRPQFWAQLWQEAQDRFEAGKSKLGADARIFGQDSHPAALEAALASIEQLGGAGRVLLRKGDAAQIVAPGPEGVVVSNPPWGLRMGDEEQLYPMYRDFGARLREDFLGWSYAILLGNPGLGRALEIYAPRRHAIANGGLSCQLLLGKVEERYFVQKRREQKAAAIEVDPSLANRLKKQQHKLKSWIQRESIEAYRLYDADLPEYAVAIDRYGDDYVVQEYTAPKEIPPEKARHRLKVALATLQDTLEIERERVFLRRRRRQRGSEQYEKMSEQSHELQIGEGPARFWVNLTDYLDTGLFLDHRKVRARLGAMAKGRSFLNLFCYTATATVHAALGGAHRSLSVDLSATYLDWAQRNFKLNGIRWEGHRLLQADCLQWLESASERFDLIFLDPPTFSNSKRMESTLDIQRDHVDLIELAMGRLAPGGDLVFSCNARKFALDASITRAYAVEDWTRSTASPDFLRRAKSHHCFRISRK